MTGQPQEAARRQLNAAGFKSRVVFVSSDQLIRSGDALFWGLRAAGGQALEPPAGASR